MPKIVRAEVAEATCIGIGKRALRRVTIDTVLRGMPIGWENPWNFWNPALRYKTDKWDKLPG